MTAIVDLGVITDPKDGFSARWSNWDSFSFKAFDEARVFARGVVCGLRTKYRDAAVQLRYQDGTREVFC